MSAKTIKERPNKHLNADDPLEKRSIWVNWFHYIYFGLVVADLLLEFYFHTILIPIKMVFSAVLIYEVATKVHKAYLNKSFSLHGMLLIISLIGALLGDVFAVYNRDVLKTGLSLGLYIMSRVVLAIIYYYHVFRSEVNSGLEVAIPSILVPAVISISVFVTIQGAGQDGLDIGIVFLITSAFACSGAFMCAHHVKKNFYLRIAIGMLFLTIYDSFFVIARFREWGKRNYYTPLAFINYLAWYLITQGGIGIIKFYDVEKKSNMTQSVIKPPTKME